MPPKETREGSVSWGLGGGEEVVVHVTCGLRVALRVDDAGEDMDEVIPGEFITIRLALFGAGCCDAVGEEGEPVVSATEDRVDGRRRRRSLIEPSKLGESVDSEREEGVASWSLLRCSL